MIARESSRISALKWANRNVAASHLLNVAGAVAAKFSSSYVIGARRTITAMADKLKPGDSVTFDTFGYVRVRGRIDHSLRNVSLSCYFIKQGITGFTLNSPMDKGQLYDALLAMRSNKQVNFIRQKDKTEIEKASERYRSMNNYYLMIASNYLFVAGWAALAAISPDFRPNFAIKFNAHEARDLLSLLLALESSILVHEAGHAAAAIYRKFRIKEIAIGSGPTLFSLKIRNTDLHLKLVPLGGHVVIPKIIEQRKNMPLVSRKDLRSAAMISNAGVAANIMTCAWGLPFAMIDPKLFMDFGIYYFLISLTNAFMNMMPILPFTDGYWSRDIYKAQKTLAKTHKA